MGREFFKRKQIQHFLRVYNVLMKIFLNIKMKDCNAANFETLTNWCKGDKVAIMMPWQSDHNDHIPSHVFPVFPDNLHSLPVELLRCVSVRRGRGWRVCWPSWVRWRMKGCCWWWGMTHSYTSYTHTYTHFYCVPRVQVRPAIYLTLPNLTLSYLIWTYLTLPYLTFPYLTWSYLTLSYLTLPHLTLPPYLTLPYLTLPYLTLPYLTLPYLTLPYLTLPYLTLPYITLPYLT